MARIEDYALIGDLQTAALVGRDGSIDWACFPRFDSGACFAALLGTPEHGRWIVAPRADSWEAGRRYRPRTLILETEWETVGGPDALCFRTPVEQRGENLRTLGEFTVREGDRVPFTLTWFPSNEDLPKAISAEDALQDTVDYWEEWADMGSYKGKWQEEVHHSLVVLKALTYAPTGGIVAAATTSLPEKIGGERNWDYRFCWLRDATLTLLAFINAGYLDEAHAWRTWLLRAAAGEPKALQIMYGVAGERRLTENTVDWLPGYERSRPVRIGNAASEQLQLDVYGEIVESLWFARQAGIPAGDHGWG